MAKYLTTILYLYFIFPVVLSAQFMVADDLVDKVFLRAKERPRRIVVMLGYLVHRHNTDRHYLPFCLHLIRIVIAAVVRYFYSKKQEHFKILKRRIPHESASFRTGMA